MLISILNLTTNESNTAAGAYGDLCYFHCGHNPFLDQNTMDISNVSTKTQIIAALDDLKDAGGGTITIDSLVDGHWVTTVSGH